MHPVLIELGGVTITTYGLFMALAFITLWLCSVWRARKLDYPDEFIQNLLTIVVIAAFIFARLLHVAVNLDYYSSHPKEIFFSREGFVFLGGFVGAVVLSIFYTVYKKQSVLGVADLFAPFLALAQGIGRIGCFLFGCCFGKVCPPGYGVQFPQDSPAFWDQVYKGIISQDAPHAVDVYPTQLYHSLFNFIHFGLLLFVRSKQTFRGQVAMMYLMVYSLGRFSIEFFRGDYRGALGPFSTSQLISMVMFMAGFTGYMVLRSKKIPPEVPVQKIDENPAPSEKTQ